MYYVVTMCFLPLFTGYPSPAFSSPYRNRLESVPPTPNPHETLMRLSTMLVGSVLPGFYTW